METVICRCYSVSKNDLQIISSANLSTSIAFLTLDLFTFLSINFTSSRPNVACIPSPAADVTLTSLFATFLCEVFVIFTYLNFSYGNTSSAILTASVLYFTVTSSGTTTRASYLYIWYTFVVFTDRKSLITQMTAPRSDNYTSRWPSDHYWRNWIDDDRIVGCYSRRYDA